MKTFDLLCQGYELKADLYEGDIDGPVMLTLIGRSSYRKKQHYVDFGERLAKDLGITSLVLDYSGHGDSPFNIENISPAQHFLEVITAFDWLTKKYQNMELIVMGSSYGGFLATQLTKYRTFDALILRAPAIYRPADFYTLKRNDDAKATAAFRRDAEALAKHPLLTRASSFAGRTLLIMHENDETIPRQTTDSYRNAFQAEEVIIPDVTHSLDDATQEQITAYFNVIFDWLEKE